MPPPSFADRRAAWRALSGCDDVDDVAAKFRLSIESIAAAEVARVAARAHGAERPEPADLDEGARRPSRAGLSELAMFAGDSGARKTLAAQVLACELGSTYSESVSPPSSPSTSGRNEKNLERIFVAAEGSNAILFFDEADALLGMRRCSPPSSLGAIDHVDLAHRPMI